VGKHVLDRDPLALAQPVGTVLRLEVVRRHPVEVLEDDVRGRGQVETNPAGDEIADRHAHAVIGLEPVDRRRMATQFQCVPLWRGNHVAVRQLADDFARYVYRPRLAGPEVLADAARDGVALLSWEQDTFAYADSYDEATGRYRGLRSAQRLDLIQHAGDGLLVRPEIAAQQLAADRAAAAAAGTTTGPATTVTGQGQSGAAGAGAAPGGAAVAAPAKQPNRYYGTATLDPTRVGRDASEIAKEVIAHLSGLVGAQVKVTLEIEAAVPNGVPDNVVRIVTENGRTLKFSNQGFDRD
jgi:hypothetical protein